MLYRFVLPSVNFIFQDNAPMTKANLVNFIPELWANTAIGQLRSQTCMATLATRDFEAIVANQGDTVNVPKRGTLVRNKKTAGNAVTLQNPQSDTIAVVITEHDEISFLIEDIGAAQSNQDVLAGYVEDAAIVMGEGIDVALLSEYVNIDPGNVISLGEGESVGIDEDDFLAARTLIKIVGKCSGLPRYAVIYDLAEMLTVDKFVSREFMNESSLEEAAFGQIAGFQVFENNNLIQTTSPEETHRLCFARGALTLVTRLLPSPPEGVGVRSAVVVDDGIALRVLYGYNMSYLGMQVTLDTLYGTKILRPEWICEIA